MPVAETYSAKDRETPNRVAGGGQKQRKDDARRAISICLCVVEKEIQEQPNPKV